MANITRGNVIKAASEPFLVAANGTISHGDPVGQDGTGWVRADADAVVSCQGFWVSGDAASGDVGQVARRVVYQTSTALTIGAMLFLSTTAGRIDDANPGAVGAMVQVIGWAVQASPSGLIYLSAEIPHAVAVLTLNGTQPATAGNYGRFFTADRQYRVLGAREVHGTAGTDAGAVTLTIEKLTTGTAKASGANVLSTTFNLKSTAVTPVWVGPTTTVANARLNPGDDLGGSDSGVLTAVAALACTVFMVAWER